ncbi:MAG: autotransporter-associated beta strand repeat-containing protein [Verrucomicrobiota bacterium]
MNPFNKLSHAFLASAATACQRFTLLAFAAASLSTAARAANTTLFWDANGSRGGTGTWDTTSDFWDSAATAGTVGSYDNSSPSSITANFGGTAGTVTIGSGSTINVNNVTLGASGYTIAGTDTTSLLSFSGTNQTISYTAAATITANISGSDLTITGVSGSQLALNGNNSGLTGTTILNLNGGSIGVNPGNAAGGTAGPAVSGATNNAFGSSTLEFTSAGQINFRDNGNNTTGAETINYGNNILLNGGDATFNVGRNGTSNADRKTFALGTVTFNTASVLSLAGNLTSAPSYRLSFSGATLVANGTVRFEATGGNASIGAITEATPNSGKSFTLSASSFDGVGSTAGNLTITGASSYTGGTNVQIGQLLNGIDEALPDGTVLTLGLGGNGATYNLNGFNQTVGGLATAGTAASQTITNAATGASTLTYSGATSAFGGAIKDGGTGKTLGVTMSAGSLTLSGANTYIGPTTVNGGTLVISGSTAAGSAVAVNGGTLNVTGTVAGTVNVGSSGTLTGSGGGTIGALTLTGGSTVNLQDSTIGTLNGSTLTLSGGTGPSILNIDVSSGTSTDVLAFTGAAGLGSNQIQVNVDALTGAAIGDSYTFISANGGLNINDFVVGNLTGLSGDTFAFSGGGDSITLTIESATPPTPGTYYFTGANGTSFTDPGNYSNALNGGTAETGALGAATDVVIAADTPANTGPSAGSDVEINSLTFNANGAGGEVGGSGTITLDAAGGTGLTDDAGGTTTETVAAPLALGSDQTWNVTNAGNTLAITGGISGNHALALSGNGTFNFATGNTYHGGTTVEAHTTLLVSNGSGVGAGSATGDGAFTLQQGATLGGAGTINASRFDLGKGGSGTAQVIVGTGGANDVTSTLTLTGTTAAGSPNTINSANLTFNLATGSSASNALIVGGSTIDFTSTQLTFNLVGSGSIQAGRSYTLIEGTSLAQYSGFETTENSLDQFVIQSGGGLSYTFATGAENTFYAGSYLYVTSSGDIDVEVVPEPSTWAMMLGGLGLLLLWQRRRIRA